MATFNRRKFLIAAGATGAAAAGIIGYTGTSVSLVPGVPRAASVPFNVEELPSSADVVVIGGGIVGTSTALSLAEGGLDVVLLEKGVIAGEASGRADGLVEGKMQDAQRLPLIGLSKKRWRTLNQVTGEQTGYRTHDIVEFFDDEETLSYVKAWRESVKGIDIDPGVWCRGSNRQAAQRLIGAVSARFLYTWGGCRGARADRSCGCQGRHQAWRQDLSELRRARGGTRGVPNQRRDDRKGQSENAHRGPGGWRIVAGVRPRA